METTYYLRVHIESAGTEYQKDENSEITKSQAGHVWYQVYEKDNEGSIIDETKMNAGYSLKGIINDDEKAYLGDPAFSTSELELTKEQFDILKKFGDKDGQFAIEHGFGNDDYNVLTNSCIDYTWKAMELAGINRGDFEGAVWPMTNKEYLEIVVNDGLALNKYLAHFYDDESFRGEMKDMLAHAHLLGLGYTPSNSQIIQRVDPLILDLNGDGVKTTSLDNSNAFFDLSGNGMSNLTGWVDKSDGLLVYDRNNNGKIDDINELFGNESKSGFEALKEFDSNKDGKIDSKDSIYEHLKVWQDVNGDGISQADELKTLSELGITSINLNSTLTNVDSNGNRIKAVSLLTKNSFIKPINSSRFYEVRLTN
ncbi:MAG: hypothetical protein M0Q25_07685 [Sulfurospirillaceae bacterium]|nr:hypothetical protein [Sulfurospirillaceae bacterium]